MTRTRFEDRRARERIAVGNSYLTPREYQVIAMYIDGVRQAEMPRMLACGVKTINSHLRVSRERLGAKTIHQLVAMVAAADALRERDRSSNRDDSRSTVSAARNRVDAVTGDSIGPGAAPSRAL